MTLISTLAEDLAGEFRLQPLLEKILTNAVRLLDCHSGSICTIDETSNTYRKEVDLDVHCQAGQIFRLDEGVTGAVKRAGRCVSFRRYADVPFGHIDHGDDRFRSPVIGIPLTHNHSLIGAFIVFGQPFSEPFAAEDSAQLELFATHASIAIVNARAHTAQLQHALSERVLTDHRLPGRMSSHDMFSRRLLPDHLLPDHSVPTDALPSSTGPLARLTAREREVRDLVVLGMPDKLVASALGISVKTVEKHVGTILRKTGAHNRTTLAALARSA